MSRLAFGFFALVSIGAVACDDTTSSSTSDSTTSATSSGTSASGSSSSGGCVSTACSELLDGGAWDNALSATDFQCPDAAAAYDAFNTCACLDTDKATGCGAICDGDLNGTSNPNFCNGVPALAICSACLNDTCGATKSDCAAN